ncbi:hypothetical protein CROQUDRAFT_669529 [Cronartium quercuum f. sp. fusiforme G11]|uniref:glucan 1,3-beta-glucosidase n=1 Tax=Cronartium quercuum f. sp. fusiforme G11 TaxID=708437 RepID=A0A9P6NRM1_9BASI|nr:hypothetical protein CROQUDRAFT_669529 [Cronartium quercuum f. sp. fusiforme G11]
MSSSYEYLAMSQPDSTGRRQSPASPIAIPISPRARLDEEHRVELTAPSPPPSPGLPVPPKFLSISPPGHNNHASSSTSSLSPSLDPNEVYHSLPPHQASFHSSLYPPSPFRAVDRDSCTLSSIHTHDYPVRRFLGPRDSFVTWQTESDSDHTRIGSESPWMNKIGSSGMLDRYDDETDGQGHVYPSPNLGPEKQPTQPLLSPGRDKDRARRRKILISLVIAILLIILAIAIGAVISLRKSNASNSLASSGSGVTSTATGQVAKLWGVGGDKITTEDGSSFVYNNTLGGTWVAVPYNDTARCQDDSPPLNQPWDYSRSRIYGVNLGGWLVLEPFIVPYLFEKFNDINSTNPTVVDEWTLSAALGADLATTLEKHYKTFITEKDFADIAAAGLNWVRLPVGWWMIETWQGEPFLEGVAFKYFVKALNWARKYGLRVNLDLHAVPGSQNGYNHSGRLGKINFLVGLMGVANAQRTLNYIRTLTEFVSQPQYVNVVPMFSVLNEALVQKIGADQIRAFYLQVYNMVRSITGYGLGKGPMIVIHDGFTGQGAGHLGWGGYLKGADRLGLDTHTYFAFDKQSNDSMDYNAFKPCTYWAKSFNQTNADFGFNFAGEYSLAINDCGQWINNIGVGSRFDGTYPSSTAPDTTNFPTVGSCTAWNDYSTWSPELKKNLIALADSSMDAMQNSFFWTWKISQSTRSHLIPNPLWSYSLGLSQGWIRPDARRSIGGCARAAAEQGVPPPVQPWTGPFQEWQTGGHSPTSAVDPAQLAQYANWPPTAITAAQGAGEMYNDVANLPMYTATGAVVRLVADQPSYNLFPAAATATSPGSGWTNAQDTAGWYVGIAGCTYPDPWNANGLPAPTGPFCASGASAAPAVAPTPPPTLAR